MGICIIVELIRGRFIKAHASRCEASALIKKESLIKERQRNHKIDGYDVQIIPLFVED